MSDNVTPIAPTDPPCSSCGAVVRVADRFDPTKHGEHCRQPPIRMARVEGQLEQLLSIVQQLVGQGNDTVTNQVDLHKRLEAVEVARLGSSEKHADQRVDALARRMAELEGCIMTGAWAHRSFPDAVLDERQREVKAQMDEARARLNTPDKPQ